MHSRAEFESVCQIAHLDSSRSVADFHVAFVSDSFDFLNRKLKVPLFIAVMHRHSKRVLKKEAELL